MSLRLLLSAVCLGLLAASTLSGCRTPQAFPTPGADWSTLTGQAHYSNPDRSVIGEVVIRQQGADNFQLGFSSGPGFPLLKLWLQGDSARAEGALARGSWQGSTARAPKPLQGWVSLGAVFARLPGSGGSFSGPGWQAVAEGGGRNVRHLEVKVAATGERFVFHFTR